MNACRLIHAVVHVHGCLANLLPVLKRLQKDQNFKVTVTLKYPDHLPVVRYQDRDAKLLEQAGILFATDYKLFNQFLSSSCPRLLLTAADDAGSHHAIGRDCVNKAKKIGIPTMVLQHGAWNTEDVWQLCKKAEYAFSSDKVMLWGELFYQGYIDIAGMDPNRLQIVGSPKFDDIFSDDIIHLNKEFRKKFDLGDLFYCFYPVSCLTGMKNRGKFSDKEIKDFLKAIFSAVIAKYPDMVLVVKPHPTDFEYGMDKVIRSVLGSFSKQRYRLLSLDEKFELSAVLKGASLTIINQSTVAFESLALNVPVVSVIHERLSPGANSLCDNRVYKSVVASTDSLFNKLKKTLPDLKRTKLFPEDFELNLKKFLYKLDGKSSDRVIIEINKMIDEQFCPRFAKSLAIKRSKNKLKILQVVHNFPPHSLAGTELYTLHLSEQLQNLGHEVNVFYPHYSLDKKKFSISEKKYSGLKIFELNNESRDPIENIYSDEVNEVFEKYLKKSKYDIVHFQHLNGLSASLLELVNRMKIPSVLKVDDFWFICQQILFSTADNRYCSGPDSIEKCITCCSKDPKSGDMRKFPMYLYLRKEYLKKMFFMPDVVVATSNFLRNKLIEYGLKREIQVVNTGIKPFEKIKKNGEQGEILRLAYLGALISRKGCHILLDSWEKVKSQTAQLYIYGMPADVRYSSEIIDRISKMRNVYYLGGYFPVDLPRIFSENDMVIVPSIGENYPFVIRESLYAGVPVIAAEVAGNPEIIKHGVNGLLFKPADANDLSLKLQQIFKNPGSIKKFANQIGKVKTIETEALELEGIYLKTIAARRNKQSKVTGETNALKIFNFYDEQREYIDIVKQKEKQLEQKEVELQQKNTVIQQKEEVIQQKNVIIQQKEEVISQKDVVIRQKEEAIKQKDEIVNRKNIDIDKLINDKSALETQMSSLVALKEKAQKYSNALIILGSMLEILTNDSVPAAVLVKITELSGAMGLDKACEYLIKFAADKHKKSDVIVALINIAIKQNNFILAKNLLENLGGCAVDAAQQQVVLAQTKIISENIRRIEAEKQKIEEQKRKQEIAKLLEVLFDAEFYAQKYKLKKEDNLLFHYMEIGAKSGFWPNPLFDVEYYLSQVEDDSDAKDNPLLHYIVKGVSLKLNPHPLFDSIYYLSQIKELNNSKINPLLHFFTFGANNLKDPHPLFDSIFYRNTYLKNESISVNPLLHFVRFGFKSDCNPNPFFDLKFYKNNYLDNKSKINPLIDYILKGFASGCLFSAQSVSKNHLNNFVKDNQFVNLLYSQVFLQFERVFNYYFGQDYEVLKPNIKEIFSTVTQIYEKQSISIYRVYDILTEIMVENSNFNMQSEIPVINSQKKLKILYICGMFPSANHAGGLRLFDIITELNLRHEVDLYSVYNSSLDEKYLEPVKKYVKDMNLTGNDYLNIDEIRQWLQKIKKDNCYYDVVQFEYPNSISIINAGKEFGKKVGFTYMECASRRYLLDILLHCNEMNRIGYDVINFLRLTQLEKLAAKSADFTIALTNEDRDHILKFGNKSPFVVPTGVTHELFNRSLKKTKEVFSAAFIGFFDHTPNIDAMFWYLKKIHPIVKNYVKNYRMLIVGSGNISKLQEIAAKDESVVFTGYVEDIGKYLSTAHICISPLISGSGFRGKINQYSALGKPTVSTSIGLQGTPYVHNESVLKADTTEDFAQCMINLILNQDLYDRISLNCKKVVEENFSWAVQIKKLEAIYQKSIQK